MIDPAGGGGKEGKLLGTFCNDGAFIMLMFVMISFNKITNYITAQTSTIVII